MTFNFWSRIVALALMLSFGSRTWAADLSTGKFQIQGANLRIEFDSILRTRVIARFDNTEEPIGPCSASETIAAADKAWTDFPTTNQKRERVSDAFGAGERIVVTGKSGALTKAVTVTMYDEFPTMAFFDVQYTNTGTNKLNIKS